MKRLFFVLLFLLLPGVSSAETINAGFVQGIWYANDPVLADQANRIYVAIRNNTKHDFSGTIRFNDNGKRIGSSEVHALSGRLVEAWVDWNPDFGTHSVSATITNAKLHIIGGGTESVDITGLVAENIVYVDRDTDGDGIGDAEDDDDDNDSYSDADEKASGSDPFSSDSTPGDTVENDNGNDGVAEDKSKASSTPAQGLEKYIKDDPPRNLVERVTKKIEDTKESLDAYRESRTIPGEGTQTSANVEGEQPTSLETEITRSKTEEKKSVFEKIFDGFVLLFFHLWSLVLWIASLLLSFPALIEILGLLLFLYLFLRIVRRIARRPQQ